MWRFIFIVIPCIFFIACGDKQANVTQGGSVVTQQQNVAPQEEVIEEVIEEYEPQKQQINKQDLKSIYFAFDSYILSKEMFALVDLDAELLKQNPETKIILEGNTDAYGSDEYNFALGNKRAIAVKEALMVRGISKDKIQTVSFGETKPVCTKDNSAKCRQENRRVDFVIETH